MLKEKNFLLWLGLSLLGGIGVALIFLKLIPAAPLVPDNLLFQSLGIQKPLVMGFVPYWLVSKVKPESLAKLNRVTYFGLELNTDGTLVKLSNPKETEPGWQTLHNGKFAELLKGKSPLQIDTSLLVHLSNEASISALLTQPTEHAVNLVNDAEPLMKEYGFIDLNLDIESFKVASPSAQAQMTSFLTEVKKQLVTRKLGTLTTELTVASLFRDNLLEPAAVGRISDRVVLMAYDFHYTGSFISGAVAPMGGAKEKWDHDVVESVKLATQAIPAEKIILGIPLYGYEWETLSNTPESAVIPGTGKTATTARIDQIKKDCPTCQIYRDEVSRSPYLILPPNADSAVQQIYFEDVTSIQQKIELAKTYKLGGVAFWAMGYEGEGLLTPLDNYRKMSELLNFN